VLLYVLERERKRDSFLSSLSERERERGGGGVRYLERGGGESIWMAILGGRGI